MTKKAAGETGLNEALRGACALVEEMFEGVICEWQGFALPRSPTESEGVVLEVFFAPEGSGRALMRSTYQIRERIGAKHDALVSLVAHYTRETIEFYLDDVLAVLSSRYEQVCTQGIGRRQALFLDPGAFAVEQCQGRSALVRGAASVGSSACTAGQSERCWEQYGSSQPVSEQTAAA
jgi:hypothetical protein